jgi:hypothetical protein
MTTLNLQVAAGADDSRSRAAAWSGTLNLIIGEDSGNDDSNQAIFDPVNIPAGATIDSAVAVYTAFFSRSGTTVRTNIGFEAADDAAQVSDETDFESRAYVATVIAWDAVAAQTVGVEYSSPDLAASLQDVVDRPGWVSGQATNLIWHNDGSDANAFRQEQSYDDDSAEAPKLDIDYTAGGGGPAGSPWYQYASA